MGCTYEIHVCLLSKQDILKIILSICKPAKYRMNIVSACTPEFYLLAVNKEGIPLDFNFPETNRIALLPYYLSLLLNSTLSRYKLGCSASHFCRFRNHVFNNELLPFN